MVTNINTVVSNLLWRFFERSGSRCISLLVMIILARLLTPEAFGTVAIISVILEIFLVFMNCGMGTALIQKKNADDLDFSSLFYFNILFSLLLYIILYMLAPYISKFYNNYELKNLIRTLGITLIIYALRNIQNSYISKNMLFKCLFYSTLVGTIISAIFGIYLAYKGYGAWALVMQHLINDLINIMILWMTVKWRPKMVFSLTRLKLLFNYAWKLLLSYVTDTLYRQARSLIIGKLYSSADLAFYNKGHVFPSIIVDNINNSIDSVLLPLMSNVQEDIEKVKSIVRRSIMTSTFILFPSMIGLAVCSDTIVRIILTDKWIPTIFFLRIFCFTYAFSPIHTANLNAIKALGRSDIFLKLEIIKKVIGLIMLISTMYISVKAMAYSLLAISITSQIINTWPNWKILNYSYIEQLHDILPSLSCSIVMGTFVFLLSFLNLNSYILLSLQFILGIFIYFILVKTFKLESYQFCILMINNFFNKIKY